MNKNERDSIRAYNNIASTYDETFDGRFTVKFKKKMLELCEVSDGDSVLDVGCGNGTLINEIYNKAEIQAFGIDISPNMIEECKTRYKEITFDVSSAEDLSQFKDNSFDTVTMCCVLHHLNNAENFLKEAQRILKLGGFLLIGDPWLPWGIRHFTDWIISPLLREGDNKVFSHKMLKRIITGNDFKIIDVYKKGLMQIIKARKI